MASPTIAPTIALPTAKRRIMAARQPMIVGIGGTARPGSSPEVALELALAAAAAEGAKTQLCGGAELSRLPLYGTEQSRCALAKHLVDCVRRADGIIIASAAYHGSISGLVKNALDYLEDTAHDERVYLDGLPVGLIVTAHGWQAGASTLAALRSIVHALRGWPTPFGAAINCSGGLFRDGVCTDQKVCDQLAMVGRQVGHFTTMQSFA